jgi:hypothetical protein
VTAAAVLGLIRDGSWMGAELIKDDQRLWELILSQVPVLDRGVGIEPHSKIFRVDAACRQYLRK